VVVAVVPTVTVPVPVVVVALRDTGLLEMVRLGVPTAPEGDEVTAAVRVTAPA
jgi:hypothetical protein